MNPVSIGEWSNPLPPGTDIDQVEIASSSKSKTISKESGKSRIDPYLKSPEYLEYERSIMPRDKLRHRKRSPSHDHHHSRSDSRDHTKRNRGRHRSRSRSRNYRRHSRSHSKRKHLRKYHSRSRSRSRSQSYSRSKHHRHHKERKHKEISTHSSKHSKSSSRSGSRSRSRNQRRHHSKTSHRNRFSRSCSHSSDNAHYEDKDGDQTDEKSDEEPALKENTFKNDGSFLEMFKKMQEEQQAEAAKQEAEIKKPIPALGKRRGGRVLKTGVVEKNKQFLENELSEPQDAWSVYMKEVKKYKEACCDDDSKTRPLVK